MEFEVEVIGYLKDDLTSLGTLTFEAKDWTEASNIAVLKAPTLVKEDPVTGFGFKWLKPAKDTVL